MIRYGIHDDFIPNSRYDISYSSHHDVITPYFLREAGQGEPRGTQNLAKIYLQPAFAVVYALFTHFLFIAVSPESGRFCIYVYRVAAALGAIGVSTVRAGGVTAIYSSRLCSSASAEATKDTRMVVPETALTYRCCTCFGRCCLYWSCADAVLDAIGVSAVRAGGVRVCCQPVARRDLEEYIPCEQQISLFSHVSLYTIVLSFC